MNTDKDMDNNITNIESDEENDILFGEETEYVKTPKILELQKKASALPPQSGVYIMKNADGKIIYVGKAKYLCNRVSQYFIFFPHRDGKTNKLVSVIDDFEFIITGNEVEALILENQLIKIHNPKYNIKLKDDKSYPFLRIDLNEKYPKFDIVRSRFNDKAKYFGPYSKGSVYNLYDEIRANFKLPNCGQKFPEDFNKKRPCLNHRINKCLGICTGIMSEEEYKKEISNAIDFIRGDYDSLISGLTKRMEAAAEDLNFEKAAKLRNKMLSIERMKEKQQIVTSPKVEQDVFGLFIGETGSTITILHVRFGMIIEKLNFNFSYSEILDGDGYLQFIENYYLSVDYIPKQILLSISLESENMELLSAWLNEKAGYNVKILSPKKGDNKHIIDIAVANAKQSQKDVKTRSENDLKKLMLLAKVLGLETVPEYIEAYDVSNTGNEFITCGMIVSEKGSFKKKNYRSFNIKTTEYQDDYTSMAEAVRRRFTHYNDVGESSSFKILPDLILVDGGKGHVGVIKEVINELNISAPVFGMVKDQFHKTRTLTDGTVEIDISRDQTVFTYIYKIQEEVHRFTFGKMDSKRRNALKKLKLESIKNIGKAKVKKLFEHFSTIDEMKKATVEDFRKVKGISEQNAVDLFNFFSESK